MTKQEDTGMDRLHITGFDSAWGGTQRGAMCDLWIDKGTGCIEIDSPPVSVRWREAIQRVVSYAQHTHHILAIDQGLGVPNQDGLRPGAKMLAKALGKMECSAYPSNRSNDSCFGPNAGIWAFLTALQQHGYDHKPMSVPQSKTGRYYFECYPHPTIIALLNRLKVLKYKCRHGNQAEWKVLVDFLTTLPVINLPRFVDELAFQNKANEDKLDSIVCAYTAVLWWQHGVAQSSMIGNMKDGYIVTPHSEVTLKQFIKVFGTQMNDDSGTPPVLPTRGLPSRPLKTSPTVKQPCPAPIGSEEGGWCGPVELIATDTTNLSRNMREKKGKPSKVINDWMDETRFNENRLIVKFLDEDAEPEVAFVPHPHSASQKVLMADRDRQPGVWFLLVAGASKKTPLRFRTIYRYQRLD
jgi:predicted RNase H-like nuclease